MKEKLNKYIETASYLEDSSNLYVLNEIKNRFEEKRFYLPFIGQFSSGKSKLINNLLKRDILPVKNTETTAFITYIEYGKEQAYIQYTDGSEKFITFEELYNLNQFNIEMNRSIQAVENNKKIKSIHVSLDSDLLKDGLVIIDTPGINTIIESHEELAYSILPQAQYLIYVLGKPLTLTDLNIIKEINKLGIQLLFVRTRMDEIKHSEETIDEAVEKDFENLEKLMQQKVNYFPLTNEKEFLKENLWKKNFDNLYEYINANISKDVENIFIVSIEKRLSIMKDIFENKLNEKFEILKKISKDNEDTLNAKLSLINHQIDVLNRKLRIVSKEIKNDINPIENSLKLEITKEVNECINEYCSILVSINDLNNLQDNAEEKAYLAIERFSERANSLVGKKLSELINDSHKKYSDELEEIKNTIEKNIDFDIELNLSPINLNKIQDDRDFNSVRLGKEIKEIEDLLNKSDEELLKFDLKRQEILQMVEEINFAKQEIKGNLNELGMYRPKEYIIEGDNSASEALGKIGNIADWAFLFLPGKAISTGGAKIAKILSKGGKAKNVTKAVTQTFKTISKADKAKDVLYITKQVKQKADGILPTESTGILDLITFEYWLKKAGSIFDKPPRIEVDKEYEREYFYEKNNIKQKHNIYIAKEIKQLEELDLIKNKEEKLLKEKELKEKYIKKAEKQLEMEKKNIRKTAEHKAKETYILEARNQFSNKINELKDSLVKEVHNAFVSTIQNIILSSSSESILQLEELQKDLKMVLQSKGEKTEEVDNKLENINKYLNDL
ncbi:hypothetical protein SH2C18_45300 [Clostridium sediminicola]|uniref:dynamin family protein n=1 Tax=Clostridium sediminicola TaxID=3114879 RepID=UPI0031F23BEC